MTNGTPQGPPNGKSKTDEEKLHKDSEKEKRGASSAEVDRNFNDKTSDRSDQGMTE